MKKFLGAGVLALLLFAPAARAGYSGPPCVMNGGFSLNFNINPGCSIQLGPWYLYWPLEAHFITPAPCSYPFWPQPMTLPGVKPVPPPVPPAARLPGPMLPPVATPVAPPPAAAPEPILKPANFHAPAFQPVGYYSYPAPSYWYGR